MNQNESKLDKIYNDLVVFILLLSWVLSFIFNLVATHVRFNMRSDQWSEFVTHFDRRYIDGIGLIIGLGFFLAGIIGVIFQRCFMPKILKDGRWFKLELNTKNGKLPLLISAIVLIIGLFLFIHNFENFVYEFGVMKDFYINNI